MTCLTAQALRPLKKGPVCKPRYTGIGAESNKVSKNCMESVRHFATPYSRISILEKFIMYKEQWEEETAMLSSPTQMAMHPAYQKIIGLGKDAIPLILSELRRKPNHWFWALTCITDEDPVRPEQRGRISEMANAWINWGEKRGYIY